MIKAISIPIRVVSFVLCVRRRRLTVDVIIDVHLVFDPIPIVVKDSVDVMGRL